MLEWENERLFVNDQLDKVETRKGRMYYRYSELADVKKTFDSSQVLSAFEYGQLTGRGDGARG